MNDHTKLDKKVNAQANVIWDMASNVWKFAEPGLQRRAAIALKAHMEKGKTAGTIKVFGCPAEELLAGKNYMASTGAFKGLDACLDHHPDPVNAALNFHTTAAMDLSLEWEGTTAHSGQAPWDGRSSGTGAGAGRRVPRHLQGVPAASEGRELHRRPGAADAPVCAR